MKKIVLTFGLISGLILVVMMFITAPLYKSGRLTMAHGEVIGYTTIVVAMSLIFFGIKSYRDHYLHGAITFGTGLQAGVLIALVSSVMYVIGWEISLKFLYPNFMESYIASVLQKAVAEGMSAEKMEELRSKMTAMETLYANPVKRMGLTLIEVFPIGLLFALASAGILRKKEVLPA